MEGYAKLTIASIEELIRDDERKASHIRSLQDECDRLHGMIMDVIQLIDEEADEKMECSERWNKPTSIYISDIAKAVGLDWDDYLSNWEEEHKEKWGETWK